MRSAEKHIHRAAQYLREAGQSRDADALDVIARDVSVTYRNTKKYRENPPPKSPRGQAKPPSHPPAPEAETPQEGEK